MKKRTILAAVLAILLIVLPTALLLSIRHPRIQHYLVNSVAEMLSSKLNAKVSVGAVYFRLFNRLALKDVCVQRLNGDTVLFVGQMLGTLTSFRIQERYIEIGGLQFADMNLHLERDTAGVLNIYDIVQHLRQADTTATTQPAPVRMRVRDVSVTNMTFCYTDFCAKDTLPAGIVDFRRLRFDNVALKITNLNTGSDTICGNLEYLTGQERSGFNLHKLEGEIRVAPTFISVSNLDIEDDYSHLYANQCRVDFASFADFKNMLNKVELSAQINSSQINMRSLGFFVPTLKKEDLPILISGTLSGTPDNINGHNLKVGINAQTFIGLDLSAVGLPNLQSTFFTANINNITCNVGDVVHADSLMLNARNAKRLAVLKPLGTLRGKARFTGFLYDFMAEATLASDIGSASANITCTRQQDLLSAVHGTLHVADFHLGKILRDTLLGRFTMNGNVNGTMRDFLKMNLNVEAKVTTCEIKRYRYRNATLRGMLTERAFRGSVACADSNMMFDLRGIARFGKKEISHYNGVLDLHRANLVATGILPHDSIAKLSFRMSVVADGNSFNDLTGVFAVKRATYVSATDTFNVGDLNIDIRNEKGMQQFKLTSSLADAWLTAKGGVTNLLPVADSLLRSYVPQYRQMFFKSAPQLSQSTLYDYEFYLHTKRLSSLQRTIFSWLTVADSTSFSGRISSDASKSSLHISSPFLNYSNITLADFMLSAETRDSSLYINANADSVAFNNVNVRSWNMDGVLHSGRLMLNVNYQANLVSGKLAAQLRFYENMQGKKSVDVGLYPSTLVLGQTAWHLSQSSINIEENRYMVDELRVENGNQLFYVNGVISPRQSDSLLCELRDLSIDPVMRTLTASKKVDLDGKISGMALFRGLLSSSPQFSTDIRIDTFQYFDYTVGNVQLRASIDNERSNAPLFLNIVKNGIERLNVDGALNSKWELEADAKMDRFEMKHVEPVVHGVLADIGGTLTGDAHISGPLKHLRLNGLFTLDSGQLRVCYTNCLYKVASPISLENSTLYVRNATAYDDVGNSFLLNFTLADLTTPGGIDYMVKVLPQNTHVVSTTELQNDYFYGQGYATGAVQISGRTGEANISVAATTNDKTSIAIPLSAGAQTQSRGFIRFVAPSKNVAEAKVDDNDNGTRPTNMHAEIDLNITNDAEVQLLLNPLTGDMLKGSGVGNVKMVIEPLKSVFRVMGGYIIQRGEYTVSLQNLVSKKFKIESGSTINFNGDVAMTTANIEAVYKVRAPLAALFGDTTPTSRYRRPVSLDCKVLMTGRLTAPNLKFSIDAPGTDSETRDLLQAQLSTEDNIAMQFISLLLFDQFMPQQQLGTMGQNLNGATLGSFVTAQFSQLLSQFVTGDIDISLTPSTDLSNIDLALSYNRSLTDRVLFSVSVEQQSSRKQIDPNSSGFVGDADLEVLLDKSGKLRLRLFTHSNEQYTQVVSGTNRFGVGVVYQEDFDSFSDLWDAMFKRKKK